MRVEGKEVRGSDDRPTTEAANQISTYLTCEFFVNPLGVARKRQLATIETKDDRRRRKKRSVSHLMRGRGGCVVS